MPTLDSTSCGTPVWPIASLRNEESGTVQLVFLIGTDGKVKETRIKQSSGFPRLDEAAKQGLAVCRFTPYVVNGTAQPAWIKMAYRWVLEDSPEPSEEKLTAAKQQAAGGDPQAQYALAMMYLTGQTAKFPRGEMEGLLKLAAAKQHAPAQLVLGALSLAPPGVVYNAPAADQFRIAAEQGDPQAEMIYGLLLVHGHGVAQNPGKGIATLRKSYGRGTNSSGAYLGAALIDHAESPDDIQVALKLLQFGAAQDETIAHYKLGHVFASGQGVQQNYVTAIDYYRRAASANFRPAILALAALYEGGKGDPTDLAEARKLRANAAKLKGPD